MTLIRHFTKPQNVQSILTCGIINRERSNSWKRRFKLVADYYGTAPHMSTELLTIKRYEKIISDAVGDYVWLTEERFANTAQASCKRDSDLYFEFDSEEIGAQKWHYFKKKFTNELQRKIVRAIDKSAKQMGDNPYCYWICETTLPIALAKPTGIMLPNREAA